MRRILGLMAIVSLAGCGGGIRQGIVPAPSASWGVVRNGTAFDRAVLDVSAYDTVVLPSRAKLHTTADGRALTVDMEKSLGFMGHPPERVTIDQARQQMGCAWRSEGKKLHLATFGEFDSGIEGGKSIELSITVPAGMRVERDDAYEMDRQAQGAAVSKLKQQSADGRSWCAPENSSQRWNILADEPDPKRAAEHARVANSER